MRPDPSMFLGYWNDEAATAAKFRGDWLLTGEGTKFVDETRNAEENAEERARRASYRQAVEEYLASPLAVDILPEVTQMLKNFEFSALGIGDRPTVKQVHQVRDLMDLQVQMGQPPRDGGTSHSR